VQCVVLAGGLGTRMRRHTRSVPKAMIPVAGEPFIRHQLRLLAAGGVDDVVLSVGHLREVLEAEVAVHAPEGLTVRCIADGPVLLGTAGALRQAAGAGLLADTFFLTYGDSYLRLDYREIWDRFDPRRYRGLMTVLRNDAGLDVSNADVAGGVVRRYRKGVADPAAEGLHHVDHGLSILQRSVVEELVPQGVRHDLAQVFEELAARGHLQGHEVHERFYEIGSERGLADLERLLGAGQA
jgi:NDP-sugar pyrophosphorylase family protein